MNFAGGLKSVFVEGILKIWSLDEKQFLKKKTRKENDHV